jgi:predicted glycosyltransferase
MADRPTILIYVQHLLGSGHLRRAAILGRALAGTIAQVRIASGGLPVPGLAIGDAALEQLAPVRCERDDFSALTMADGAPVDETFKARRRDRLLELLEETRPEALIVEMFPFGRRQMRFELLPLLERARALRPRPLIVCSVRDILQTGRKPERIAEAARWAETLFDRILVHGDPKLARFEETFPPAAQFAERLHYTGYLAPEPPSAVRPGDPGWDEVVVSAGGGAVGAVLMQAAAEARAASRLSGKTWRLLTGHAIEPAARGALDRAAAASDGGIVIEASRPDFLHVLAACAVSVSQGGYNTVADILSAEARSVIVPFAAGGETEQTLRAERLAARGRAVMLAEDALDPARLARAVDAAAGSAPAHSPVDLGGATASVRLLRDWLEAHCKD